jgi:hypothetical protein
MEAFPFLPASQPTTSTPSFFFPQSVPNRGPSSLQLPPSSQYRPHDFLDSRLPQNTSRVLAESQASGRLPELFNSPAGQAVRTAKTVAAAKHKTVRFGAQPNMWKAGSASTLPRGMQAPRQVSQLPEVAQPQPPPVKARAHRVTRAAKSRKTELSHQPATTMPSWRDNQQSASQGRYDTASTAQTAAPQVEATPISTHAGPSATVVLSAASWGEGEHGEGKLAPNWGLDSWATATAAQILRHCRLESLPLDLIEQVLPRFRAYLKKSGHSAGAKTSPTNTAQFPAPVAPPLLQLPWPPSVETSELFPVPQLPAPFYVPEQAPPFFPTEYPVRAPTTVALGTEESAYDPGLWSMVDRSTWAPEPGPSTMAEPVLTYEELEALRQEIDQPLYLPSNSHFSTELAQGAGMGGIWAGGLDSTLT